MGKRKKSTFPFYFQSSGRSYIRNAYQNELVTKGGTIYPKGLN